MPYYITLLPVVIEHKALQLSIGQQSTHSVLRGYHNGVLPWFRAGFLWLRGWIAAPVPWRCGDVTAHENTTVMGTVSWPRIANFSESTFI